MLNSTQKYITKTPEKNQNFREFPKITGITKI